ncbi:S-adenosyl-L-methionine-dependent methyltransferase [Cubamyces sp. BRFM 1775]|nr:S-adenosyl-L-methionine-dependent methyltransferase [Cubamyces sp. BRFM 1775]
MTFATLRALHTSIGAALDELERLYRNQSLPEALDFPDLDEPYYPNASHTLAEERAEKLKADRDVAFTIRRIVAACGQLSATVNRTWLGVMDTIQGGQLAACLRFMEQAHIVEILRHGDPRGIHVKDICTSIAKLRPRDAPPDLSILSAARLSHILRVLATSHWLREVSPDVFANNRRSSSLDCGKTLEELRASPEKKYVDTDGAAALAATAADEAFKSVAYLTEWLLPDTRTGSLTVDAKEDNERDSADYLVQIHAASPFNLAFNTKLGFFEWLELPENMRRYERFGHSMAATCQWETQGEILQAYPWAALPSGAVLVDVGGGIGSTSLPVAQAHPHLNLVVEDRPQTVARAPSAWGPTYASLFESGRVTWRSRDFFTPWEHLANGKSPSIFLLRLVMHDWPDEQCQTILHHLRAAALPHTRLIVGESILPFACRSNDELAGDDMSLLPNLGQANMPGYLIDIMMMTLLAAGERTVQEMSALMRPVGWVVESVRRSPGSLWAYITCVPV